MILIILQYVAEFGHTLQKFKRTKKNIFYFPYAKVKVTKVQSVLKTDQRADVSAHAFFSAHEIQLLGLYDFQRSCSLLIKTSKNVSFILQY